MCEDIKTKPKATVVESQEETLVEELGRQEEEELLELDERLEEEEDVEEEE
jgi:hypothetical protein